LPQPPRASNSTNQIKEPRGGGVEMRGELGDLVAEALERDVAWMSRDDARAIDVHHDSPRVDFNPRFSRALEATRTRDRTLIAIFWSSDSLRVLWRRHVPLKGR